MKIKICPKCGGKKIQEVKEGNFLGMPYHPYGGTNHYRCSKCGFTSALFPEKEVKEKKP